MGAEISGKQTSTAKDPPTLIQEKPSNLTSVKNGCKECNSCHEIKPLSQFRNSEGHGLPALPNAREGYCIPCEDTKRKALAASSSGTRTGQTTISGVSNGPKGQPFSQRPSEGSTHIRGSFTAKRGGGHSASHTRNDYSKAPTISGESTTHQPATSNHAELVAPPKFPFTPQQWDVLDAEHKKNPFPSDGRLQELAITLSCKWDQVRVCSSKLRAQRI